MIHGSTRRRSATWIDRRSLIDRQSWISLVSGSRRLLNAGGGWIELLLLGRCTLSWRGRLRCRRSGCRGRSRRLRGCGRLRRIRIREGYVGRNHVRVCLFQQSRRSVHMQSSLHRRRRLAIWTSTSWFFLSQLFADSSSNFSILIIRCQKLPVSHLEVSKYLHLWVQG